MGVLAPDFQAVLDEVATAEREGMPVHASRETWALQQAGLIEVRVQSWSPEVGPALERAKLTDAGHIVYGARRPAAVEAINSYADQWGEGLKTALALLLSLAFFATVMAGAAVTAYGSWWQVPTIGGGGWLCFLLWLRRQADRQAGVEMRGKLERLVPKVLRREGWDA